MAYKNVEDRRAYARQYMREKRAWLASRHFCTECKKQDAWTLAGHKRCFDCSEGKLKETDFYLQTEANFPVVTREDRARWPDNRKCYICGSPIEDGYRVCENHHKKLINQSRVQHGTNEKQRARK